MQQKRLFTKATIIAIFLFSAGSSLKAQIGINTINPDTSAAIDIQGINKGVLFPRITAAQLPNIFQPATGLTLFQTDNNPGLYYNVGTPLSPNWRTIGMTHIDSNIYWKEGFVGIGTKFPKVPLHVKFLSNGNAFRLEGAAGGHTYMEFYANGPSTRSGYFGYPSNGTVNIEINNSRTDGNIVLNTNGTGKVTSNKDINTSEKIQEDGNDLIPAGVIVMWSGSPSAVPAGWALCDGSNSTPNLKGRFIIGYDVGNTDYNAIGKTGGYANISITTAQMPAHNHGSGSLVTSSAGNHNHTVSFTSGSGIGSADRLAAVDNSNGTATKTTNSTGAHTHSISGSTASSGSGNAHENRPPYYTLAYIIKL